MGMIGCTRACARAWADTFSCSAGSICTVGGEWKWGAGHAKGGVCEIGARTSTCGGSLPNPFLMRLVEIDGLIAVHGRAEAGCPVSAPERRSSFPPFPKIPNP